MMSKWTKGFFLMKLDKPITYSSGSRLTTIVSKPPPYPALNRDISSLSRNSIIKSFFLLC